MGLQNYKKTVVLILALAAAIVAVVTNRTEAEDTNKTMNYHCDMINKDPTRPDLRHCTKPISLDDNVFTFQIQNTDIEIYRIVKAAKNDSINYYYIFETSKRTH